jgi:hypothetical protein
MARGGHRQNAGRKAAWQNSETQVIRVPKILVPQLLKIAKDLDRGQVVNSAPPIQEFPQTPLPSPEIEAPFISPGQLSLLEQSSFNDSVTNSKSDLLPLSGRALSRRLNIDKSGGAVSRRKLDPDFEQWTRSIDGVGWIYNEQDKMYHPAK